MLTNKYEKKKNIAFLKKKSRIAKKIENDKDEIYAFNEHCEKYICNYHIASETSFAYSTSFKIREIRKDR